MNKPVVPSLPRAPSGTDTPYDSWPFDSLHCKRTVAAWHAGPRESPAPSGSWAKALAQPVLRQVSGHCVSRAVPPVSCWSPLPTHAACLFTHSHHPCPDSAGPQGGQALGQTGCWEQTLLWTAGSRGGGRRKALAQCWDQLGCRGR